MQEARLSLVSSFLVARRSRQEARTQQGSVIHCLPENMGWLLGLYPREVQKVQRRYITKFWRDAGNLTTIWIQAHGPATGQCGRELIKIRAEAGQCNHGDHLEILPAAWCGGRKASPAEEGIVQVVGLV